MNRFLSLALLLAMHSASAEPDGRVALLDGGWREARIGSGAPLPVRGLLGASQEIEMHTGAVVYGLRYAAAIDPSLGGEARPGEGYIGMSKPSPCNWYTGGFLDLEINGRSVGLTRIQSFSGHVVGNRGYVDYLFDTTQAIVRIRFVAEAGSSALYGQVRLEPRAPIQSLKLNLRCYPSAFVSTADRHVRTPVRDLPQGQNAELDVAGEYALFYYDPVVDRGVQMASNEGVGPCAVLWAAGQMTRARVSVGSYSVETRLELNPAQREFRFIFWDDAGRSNADAMAAFFAQSSAQQATLKTYDFSDPRISTWPFDIRQAEKDALLARLPSGSAVAYPFDAWTEELTTWRKQILADEGSLQAERMIVMRMEAWDAALQALKLTAMLNEI